MKVSDIQSIDDFKTFTLTYLAEADYKVTEEEKEIIFHHVSQERYEQIKALIDRLSDFECLNVISDYRNNFLSDEKVLDQLVDEMEELYKANKHTSILEKNMIMALKKVLY